MCFSSTVNGNLIVCVICNSTDNYKCFVWLSSRCSRLHSCRLVFIQDKRIVVDRKDFNILRISIFQVCTSRNVSSTDCTGSDLSIVVTFFSSLSRQRCVVSSLGCTHSSCSCSKLSRSMRSSYVFFYFVHTIAITLKPRIVICTIVA